MSEMGRRRGQGENICKIKRRVKAKSIDWRAKEAVDRDYLCPHYVLNVQEETRMPRQCYLHLQFADDEGNGMHNLGFDANALFHKMMNEELTGEDQRLYKVEDEEDFSLILKEASMLTRHFKLSTATQFFAYLYGEFALVRTYEEAVHLRNLSALFHLHSISDKMVAQGLCSAPGDDVVPQATRRLCRFLCAVLPHREMDKIECGTRFSAHFDLCFRLDSQSQGYDVSSLRDSETGEFEGNPVHSSMSHFEFFMFAGPQTQPEPELDLQKRLHMMDLFMHYISSTTLNCFRYHELNGNLLAKSDSSLFDLQVLPEEETSFTDLDDTEDEQFDMRLLHEYRQNKKEFPRLGFKDRIIDLKKQMRDRKYRRKRILRKRKVEACRHRQLLRAREREAVRLRRRNPDLEEESATYRDEGQSSQSSPVSSRTRHSSHMRELFRVSEVEKTKEAASQRSSNRLKAAIQSPWFQIPLRSPNEVRLHIVPSDGRLQDLQAAVIDSREASSLKYKVNRIKPPLLPHLFHSLGFDDTREFVSLASRWTAKGFWSDSMLSFFRKLGVFQGITRGFLLELGQPLFMDRVMGTVKTICVDTLCGAYYIFQPSYESMLRVITNLFGPWEDFVERDDMLTSDFTLIEVSLLWRAQ